MFDTTPKISNDPEHLDNFDRIFKQGKYKKDDEEAPKGDVCEKNDKKDCTCNEDK